MGRILNRLRLGKEEMVISGKGLHREQKYGNMLRISMEKRLAHENKKTGWN